MAHYIDGYVLPVAKKKLAVYRKMALQAGKMWRKCGALAYVESVGDDFKVFPGVLSFPRLIKLKPGQTVVFAYIVFKSKAHRNSVNAKVFKAMGGDGACDPENMPFDMKRMAYAGFKTLVDL